MKGNGTPSSAAVTNDYLNFVQEQVQNSLSVKQALLQDSDLLSRTAAVAQTISKAFQSKRKLLLFGNGGSAADAQHIAAEFVGRYRTERRALPALALTVNTSSLTAIGNDYAFDVVFSRQIEAFGISGDVALGISTSGNSENIVRALNKAKELGMKTVALTGATGGRLKSSVDYCLAVPSGDTPRVQECHILLGHIICEIVERQLNEE
jgi:D-sedoheptulose 7-phosphate isomerase